MYCCGIGATFWPYCGKHSLFIFPLHSLIVSPALFHSPQQLISWKILTQSNYRYKPRLSDPLFSAVAQRCSEDHGRLQPGSPDLAPSASTNGPLLVRRVLVYVFDVIVNYAHVTRLMVFRSYGSTTNLLYHYHFILTSFYIVICFCTFLVSAFEETINVTLLFHGCFNLLNANNTIIKGILLYIM